MRLESQLCVNSIPAQGVRAVRQEEAGAVRGHKGPVCRRQVQAEVNTHARMHARTCVRTHTHIHTQLKRKISLKLLKSVILAARNTQKKNVLLNW